MHIRSVRLKDKLYWTTEENSGRVLMFKIYQRNDDEKIKANRVTASLQSCHFDF